MEPDDGGRSMIKVAKNANPWTVFLEVFNPEAEAGRPLPAFDKDQHVMLFFKHYCPRTSKIRYINHLHLPIATKLDDVLPKLRGLAGIAPGSKLILWEEVGPDRLERIEATNQPLGHSLEELMDGDIIVFQRDPGTDHNFGLPTARDYFKDLSCKVVVEFCDKNIANDAGFRLKLNTRMNYDQVAKKAAAHLEVDPYLLQFFKPQPYQDGPGHPLRRNYEGLLKDLLADSRPRQAKRIYYQQLTTPTNEMENKEQAEGTEAKEEGVKEDPKEDEEEDEEEEEEEEGAGKEKKGEKEEEGDGPNEPDEPMELEVEAAGGVDRAEMEAAIRTTFGELCQDPTFRGVFRGMLPELGELAEEPMEYDE